MCTITVDAKHSKKWHGKVFGPFKSVHNATRALRAKGWINKGTVPKGVWYAMISRFTGINAKVNVGNVSRDTRLLPKEKIPQGFAAFLGD